MLALPGAGLGYNGEELGLPNVDDLPEAVLQDPVWERSGHTERGRDACRVPMPWNGDTPPFGFSSNPQTWLPIPPRWAELTVQRQLASPDSTLAFFRRALKLRSQRPEFLGRTVEWLSGDGVVFRVLDGGLICALNADEMPVPLPAGHVILASAPTADGMLPPDAAA